MRPIINPLWFYLIGICENLFFTFWIVGGFLLAAGATIGIILMCEGWDMNENIVKTLLKVLKKAIIIGGL